MQNRQSTMSCFKPTRSCAPERWAGCTVLLQARTHVLVLDSASPVAGCIQGLLPCTWPSTCFLHLSRSHGPGIVRLKLCASFTHLLVCGLLRVQEVLLQQVTQQGDNLHFVALAAAQVDSAGPDIAKTLVQDLEVRWHGGLIHRVVTGVQGMHPHALFWGVVTASGSCLHARCSSD